MTDSSKVYMKKTQRNREDKVRSTYKRKRKKVFTGIRKQEKNSEREIQEEQKQPNENNVLPSFPQQHDDDEMELLPAKRNKTVT